MAAPSAPVRPPEEAYQLADFSRLPRLAMHGDNQHASNSFERASRQRMPAEDYGEEDVDAFAADNEELVHVPQANLKDDRIKHPRVRVAASFFLFGVLNNILYVIILSAALDLVSPSTPKGLVAFFNIFPSLITKLFWPYLVHGAVRYKRRILVCTAASWMGMVVIAAGSSTAIRLLGIGLASFSSGFGEMTFLQLTTTLPTPSFSRDALGAWSSGTGGAGIGGAGLWWILRGLGVKRGIAIASVLPFAFPLVFFFLLPEFHRLDGHSVLEDDCTHGTIAQQPIFAADDDDDLSIHTEFDGHARKVILPSAAVYEVVLSTQEKIELVKPLVLKFMLPLFLVYAFEYIINTGVAPTLAFPPPHSGPWTHVFKSVRDYYPFWSLTFFLLTCLEGLMGGIGYCMTFYHVAREGEDGHLHNYSRLADGQAESTPENLHSAENKARSKARKEFRIAAAGAADSLGKCFD
ncbi:hypothetical protein QFC19_006357 [Naganishia cerealis]|uniref:Uncharacterized protein n=1 Tax=Naganishia cerealis TaxID=610337 RepID=A0ACC2VHV1_9TREE|nr:hypothetical protein QFC19_006357 [Naganishia cerealis]